jgi:hypothetical protein
MKIWSEFEERIRLGPVAPECFVGPTDGDHRVGAVEAWPSLTCATEAWPTLVVWFVGKRGKKPVFAFGMN